MKDFIKAVVPESLKPTIRNVLARLSVALGRFGSGRARRNNLRLLECIVARNKYGHYCIPQSSVHRPAAQKLLAEDVYEPNTIEFIRENCSAGDIGHAGTYFGDFLPALSEGCGAGAKVWAFEPNPENFLCAKITRCINDLQNVELAHAGLGEREESRKILTADAKGVPLGGGSRILQSEECEVGHIEGIQIVTVDDTVPADRKVSIIQLDVEGHEKSALKGALGTIRRNSPIIIIEVLPGSDLIDSEWFSDNILSLGYQMVASIHGNSVFTRNS